MELSVSKKISTLLQFAYRAKKLYFGESTLIKMMEGKIKVLVVASDISPSQQKKYLSKASYYQVEVIFYINKSELGDLFSKNEVACVGIVDNNMAKEIIRLAK